MRDVVGTWCEGVGLGECKDKHEDANGHGDKNIERRNGEVEGDSTTFQ